MPGHERGECSRYKGNELWPGVMSVSSEACVVYFKRVHGDYNKKVEIDYNAKLSLLRLTRTHR